MLQYAWYARAYHAYRGTPIASTRITITLPRELAERVRREARRRRKSQSELVREALERRLPPLLNGKRKLPFESLGRSGDGFSASNMDEYLARHWARDIERDSLNRDPDASSRR